MTDDDLDRLSTELRRRGDEWIETLRDLEAAEAQGDQDAVSEAEEAVHKAGVAIAELAIGNTERNRMARAIEHLANQDDDPKTEHHRFLLMKRRFLYDMRSLGYPNVIDIGVADIFRQLNGVEGVFSRPVDTGRGPKGYDEIDRNLIRRYVLRAFVECARAAKTQKRFLSSLAKSPTPDRFRDWSQLVPLEQRKMATGIGKAFRTGLSLSADQGTLWSAIKDDNLVEVYGYLERLDPKKVHEAP